MIEWFRVTDEETIRFLLQTTAMLAAGVFFGQLARRFHLPMVIGELCGGIFLGPTFLGRLAPGFERAGRWRLCWRRSRRSPDHRWRRCCAALSLGRGCREAAGEGRACSYEIE